MTALAAGKDNVISTWNTWVKVGNEVRPEYFLKAQFDRGVGKRKIYWWKTISETNYTTEGVLRITKRSRVMPSV